MFKKIKAIHSNGKLNALRQNGGLSKLNALKQGEGQGRQTEWGAGGQAGTGQGRGGLG